MGWRGRRSAQDQRTAENGFRRRDAGPAPRTILGSTGARKWTTGSLAIPSPSAARLSQCRSALETRKPYVALALLPRLYAMRSGLFL